MKRLLIVITLTVNCLVQTQAQDNKSVNARFLKLDVAGGFHSLCYELKDGERKGATGYGIHVDYYHFFKNNWAIRSGLGVQTFSAEATLNYTNRTEAVDADNESYTLNTIYNNWREEQNGTMLSIPLGIVYKHQLKDSWQLISSLGVKAFIPLSVKGQSAGGTIETRGYYPQYNVEMYGMPQHNLLTVSNVPTQSLDMNIMAAGTAELGVMHTLSKVNLYAGFYLDYGLTNGIEPLNKGVYQDNQYNGIFNSSQVDKVYPIACGIKMGVVFDAQSFFH